MGECGSLVDVANFARVMGATGFYEIGQFLVLTLGESRVLFMEVAEDLLCHVNSGGRPA